MYADLSGFLVGDRKYFSESKNLAGIGHMVERIREAFAWVENPEKFLSGSDWPLVPLAPYLNLMRQAIPPAHHREVFFQKAVDLFGLSPQPYEEGTS